MKTGRVHLYTGDGKGKTTAAVGLCVRAAGRSLRVAFFQFLKNGQSGEIAPLQKLGVHTETALCQKFIWDMTEEEKQAARQRHLETLERARAMAPKLDLLVLDEAISAQSNGLLPPGTLANFIQKKPRGTELVLTGRGEFADLLPLADYATEMRLLAHPYESEGLNAREGIEF